MTEKPKDKFKFSGDFVKDGFRIAKNIQLIGKEMRGLALAFAATGNNKISDQLYNVFEECEIYDEAIRNLIRNETSRGLQDAQRMSGAILSSCLDGLAISQKSKEEETETWEEKELQANAFLGSGPSF
jgi:uncharacterized protein YehS (DUF1456 family)